MCHCFGADEYYISRNVEEHRKQYSEGYKHLRVHNPIEKPSSETVQLLAKELDATKKKLRKFEGIFNDKFLFINKPALEKLLKKGISAENILDRLKHEAEHLS